MQADAEIWKATARKFAQDASWESGHQIAGLLHSIVVQIADMEWKDREAMIQFNRILFVHPRTGQTMKFSRTKMVRLRKKWNRRRRETKLRVGQRNRRMAKLPPNEAVYGSP